MLSVRRVCLSNVVISYIVHESFCGEVAQRIDLSAIPKLFHLLRGWLKEFESATIYEYYRSCIPIDIQSILS